MPGGREDRKEEDWQKELLVAFTRLETSVHEIKEQYNGRTKKLEHTVFGNEEESKIGLAEKVRYLESGWAKLTAGAVLLISVVIEALKWGGHWLLQTINGGGPKVHP